MVIGVRDEPPITSTAGNGSYPSLGRVGGYMLDTIFMDNLDADIERSQRINETIARIPPENSEGLRLRPISLLTLQPSADIREIAREHADEMPWTIRTLLGQLGVWGHDWLLPSYLLFGPGYNRALIELGYLDTMARHEELAAFLAAPRPAPHTKICAPIMRLH